MINVDDIFRNTDAWNLDGAEVSFYDRETGDFFNGNATMFNTNELLDWITSKTGTEFGPETREDISLAYEYGEVHRMMDTLNKLTDGAVTAEWMPYQPDAKANITAAVMGLSFSI